MLCVSQHAPLAQSAEQLTLNQWVPGSSPGGRTKDPKLLTSLGLFLFAVLVKGAQRHLTIPMTSFAELTSAEQVATLEPLAQHIVAGFGLGECVIESINHEFNSTFKVTTADGTKYALRINVNSQRSEGNVRAEIFWVLELSKVAGLKVPTPIANTDGEYIVSVWHELLGKNLWAVMFTWLEGEELADDPTPEALHATGAAIARMHLASRETQLPAGAELHTIKDFFWGGNDLIATSAEIAELDRETLLREIDRIEAITAALYEKTSAQIIHADVHGWNVMWNGSEAAIFDFDDCAIGLPVQDLAVTLYYLDKAGHRQSILDGYQSVAELPEYSKTDMDALILQRRIFLLNYLLETTNPEHRAMVPKYLEGTMQRIRDAQM